MLSFNDLTEFFEVRAELYNKQEEYLTYFKNIAPIKNHLDWFEEASLEFEKVNSENTFKLFKVKWANKVNLEDDSLGPKYNFTYKNLLCNQDQLLKIGE